MTSSLLESTVSLQANYANGAFGQALGFGTSRALVMVDFAQAYFVPDSPLYANRPEVLGPAAQLLQWARQRGLLRTAHLGRRDHLHRLGDLGGVLDRLDAPADVAC